jgi:MFS family permease
VKLTDFPAYVRFWVASSVSDFGTYITSIAISVIVVVRLDGSASDVGLVSAARWLPYLLFGLFAGLLADRYSRKPMIVTADFGRAAILVSIAVLGLAHWLTFPALLSLMFAFGTLALLGDAAFQSFIPQLVPRELLVRANARLQQSDSVAQTTGPAVAGWLTQLITAPAAVLLDAASYVFSGAVVATIPSSTKAELAAPPAGFRRRIAEGLRWVYGHSRLGPLVLSTHIWFLFFSMFGAVFTVFALRERDLGAGGLGVVLACSGVGSVLGAAVSLRLGEVFGAGRTIILARSGYPIAFLVIVAAGSFAPGGWAAVMCIGVGQFLIGLSLGLEGPQEMGYEQAVTPDRLLGRMAAIRRSANRGMIVIGAPLGGLLAESMGNRPAMSVAAAGMVVVVVFMVVTGFWRARIEEQLTEDEATAN